MLLAHLTASIQNSHLHLFVFWYFSHTVTCNYSLHHVSSYSKYWIIV